MAVHSSNQEFAIVFRCGHDILPLVALLVSDVEEQPINDTSDATSQEVCTIFISIEFSQEWISCQVGQTRSGQAMRYSCVLDPSGYFKFGRNANHLDRASNYLQRCESLVGEYLRPVFR